MKILPRCVRPGCLNRVKAKRFRYCSQACVPSSLRADGAQRARRGARALPDAWRQRTLITRQPSSTSRESWWIGLDREQFRVRAAVEAQRMAQARLHSTVG